MAHARRNTAKIMALSGVRFDHLAILLNTYKVPVAKTAVMPNLRPVDNCSDQIFQRGTVYMAMSEMILKVADEIYKANNSRQLPGVSGYHILVRG